MLLSAWNTRQIIQCRTNPLCCVVARSLCKPIYPRVTTWFTRPTAQRIILKTRQNASPKPSGLRPRFEWTLCVCVTHIYRTLLKPKKSKSLNEALMQITFRRGPARRRYAANWASFNQRPNHQELFEGKRQDRRECDVWRLYQCKWNAIHFRSSRPGRHRLLFQTMDSN